MEHDSKDLEFDESNGHEVVDLIVEDRNLSDYDNGNCDNNTIRNVNNISNGVNFLPTLPLNNTFDHRYDDSSFQDLFLVKDLNCSEKTMDYPLRHGILKSSFNDNVVNYIFVPSHWRPSEDSNIVDVTFKALGIPIPQFVFSLDPCPGPLFPKDRIGLKYKEHVEESFKEMGRNFQYRMISRHVSDDDRGSNEDDDNNRRKFEIIEPQENVTIPSEYIKLFDSAMNSSLSTLMKSISKALIEAGAMYFLEHHPFEADSLLDILVHTIPEKGIILPVFNNNKLSHIFKNNSVDIGNAIEKTLEFKKHLSKGIKNMLIFEDEDDKDYFIHGVKKIITTGRFCISGNNEMLSQSINSLKTGSPLVVFRYTGNAGDAISTLINNHKESSKRRMKKQTTSPENKLQFNELLIDKYLSNHDLVGQLIFNWPEYFSFENVVVVNPIYDKPTDVVLKILQMVSNSSMKSRETFSHKYEKSTHTRVLDIFLNISYKLSQFETFDTLNFLFLEIAEFSVVCIALIMAYFNNSYPNLYSQHFKLLKVLNIILPILLGIFVGLDQTFNPSRRAAILRLTGHRILSELYRYKCRICEYNINTYSSFNCATDSTKTNSARKLFTSKIDNILESIEDVDVTDLYLEAKCTMDDVRGVFNLGLVTFETHDLTYTADEYINERIVGLYKILHFYTPRYKLILLVSQTLLILLASFCSLLAAFNYQLWIPAIICFTSIIRSYLKHNKIELVSKLQSLACKKINHVMLEWEGKTLHERNLQLSKDNLVNNIENIVISTFEIIQEATTTPVVDSAYSQGNSIIADISGDDNVGAIINKLNHSLSNSLNQATTAAPPPPVNNASSSGASNPIPASVAVPGSQ